MPRESVEVGHFYWWGDKDVLWVDENSGDYWVTGGTAIAVSLGHIIGENPISLEVLGEEVTPDELARIESQIGEMVRRNILEEAQRKASLESATIRAFFHPPASVDQPAA